MINPTPEQFMQYAVVGGGCAECPYATVTEGESVNWADPDEGYYDCALLKQRYIWGEDSPCRPIDWHSAQREQYMSSSEEDGATFFGLMNSDGEAWLTAQLARWPERVDPANTTNISFLYGAFNAWSASKHVPPSVSEELQPHFDQLNKFRSQHGEV
jgi:hypothetical protein